LPEPDAALRPACPVNRASLRRWRSIAPVMVSLV
jgi:hypothetical protein